MNLPLAPWYAEFLERLVNGVKDLLIKGLKSSRLSYEEMQTALFECEAILNNHPLIYIFSTNLSSCLTRNHLGRVRKSSSINLSLLTHDPSELTTYSNQVTTIINRFEDKWGYEYIVNLRETHKYYFTKNNQPFIQSKRAVSVH